MISLTPEAITSLVKYDTVIIFLLILIAFSTIRKAKITIDRAISKQEVKEELMKLESSLKGDIKELKNRFEAHVNKVNELMLKLQAHVSRMEGIEEIKKK